MAEEEECSKEICNADDSMISHAGSSSIGDVVDQPLAPMTDDDDNLLVNNVDAGHVGEIIVSPTSSSSPWQSSQATAPSISLPNELWSKAFSYLDHNNLFMLGNVNRNFLSLSSDNSIWERLCHRRWMGKQNVARFEVKTTYNNNGAATMQNYYDGRVPFCTIARLEQFHDPTLIQPINIIGHFMYEATSWKEAFIIAEIDSQRVNMCTHELLRYKWLIHDGKVSSDLRIFEKEDNINGLCEYTKHGNNVRWGGTLQGQKITFPGVSLGVERNPYNWGWIITARNQKGAYYSVEQEDLTPGP